MSKADTTDLLEFLQSFDGELQELALWLRDFVWRLYPASNELIYDNYNALAIGWSVTDRVSHVFCSIAIYRPGKNIHFGFYWGSEIADPEKKLIGNGKQYRYLLVKNKKDFPKAYITKLTREAYVNSLAKVKDSKLIIKGCTITKAVSAGKRVAKK